MSASKDRGSGFIGIPLSSDAAVDAAWYTSMSSNVFTCVEIKFQAPHAIDATMFQLLRLL